MVRENRVEQMLTVTEVARMLNVHSNTLRRWSDQGLIKAYIINSRGDRRFDRNDIIDFLQKFKNNKNKK